MNKFLLTLVSLGVFQGVMAKDPDVSAGRYQFNNFSYKLDPYIDEEPRPLNDDKAVDDGLSTFPASVDLTPTQSVVKNQGDRGSCTFFTSNALLESLIKQKQGIEVNLSEEYLIWKVKGEAKQMANSDGSLADVNLKLVAKAGLVLEKDMPFQPSWFTSGLPCEKNKEGDSKTPTTCYSHNKPGPDVVAKVIPATAFTPVLFATSSDKIVQIIATKKTPVIIGVTVNPRGWDEKTGVVILNEEMRAECRSKPGLCGGHSIMLTGYDRMKRVFTFKNSWSPSWGKKGYGEISFDYVDQYARGTAVTGFLSTKVNIPANYQTPVVRSVKLDKVQTTLASLAQGRKAISTSFSGSTNNMTNVAFYVSAYLATPKVAGSMADDNADLVPVLEELQEQYGVYAKAGVYRIYGQAGTGPVSGKLDIPEEILDLKNVENKDTYLRFSTYIYSDTAGWVKLTRDYAKLGFRL